MTAARARKIARLAVFQFQRALAASDRLARSALLRLRGRTEIEREAEHWSGDRPGLRLGWQDLPLVRAHINRRVSGDPAANWIDAFARDFGRGFDRALNLGCGAGDLEAHALSLGLARRFLSLDISPAALDRARSRLPASVTLECRDIDRLDLDSDQFDLVFAASSLHHFTDLPRVLDNVLRGLKPGGFFVFDEYVGPSLFQWRPRQLQVINELLAALPPRLRRDLRGLGHKRRVYPRPLDDSSRDSPHEAAHSEDILPLAAARFEIVRRRDYGGAILHPLLDGIAGNFRDDRPDDLHLLSRLINAEQALEARGEIGSDFCSVVARKAPP